MEAKLKTAEFTCYNKSYTAVQRKEESRDAVVPDTQPDIAEVLYCSGKLLIRSKDVSAGRVRIEASIPADVLYRGEDGRIYTVEVTVPVFLSAEDEKISDQSLAAARLELLKLEARPLNPRKILVRGELSAEIDVFSDGRLTFTEDVEDLEHIRSHVSAREVSIVSAVTEKTFALTDEISMPPAAEGAKNVIHSGCSCTVDEVKAVGTKLIVKGRVKSRLLLINGDGELCHLEPTTDYSQIIEIGREAGNGASELWIIPSGVYCSISSESEARIGLEFHMVAQLICRSSMNIEYVDDAYSNCFELSPQWTELKLERVQEAGRLHESVRQLFETSRGLSEVLYSNVSPGRPIFEKGRMLLPISLSAVCGGAEGPWCEKRKTEISLRLPSEKGEYLLKSLELTDWAVLPVPGGMELRLELFAELFTREEDNLKYVSVLSYDEEKPLDNSSKPSLTLLRIGPDDELWGLAREYCSYPEAILSANGIGDISEAIGKLILIPKTN